MGTAAVLGRASCEWRAMVAAELVSVLGDQLAKIALSVLVFARTGSAAWAAVVYACTLLPDLIAGPVLAPLADRYARRDLMIVCATGQAACMAMTVFPGVPIALVAAGVSGVAILMAPFKAAQPVLVRDLLGAAHHPGQAQLTIIRELGQLLGLGVAGAVVGLIGARAALFLDVISFVLVALLLCTCVRRRTQPPPAQPADTAATPPSGWGVLRTDRNVHAIVASVLCVTVIVAPEAIIVPLVADLQAPTWTVGLLLACDSLGLVLLARVVCRPRAQTQSQPRIITALTVLTAAPLMAFAAHPPLPVACIAMVLSGGGASLLPLSRAVLIDAVPDAVTATISGYVRTVLRAGQGVIALVAGALATATAPATAVALIGATGVLGALGAALLWARVPERHGVHP